MYFLNCKKVHLCRNIFRENDSNFFEWHHKKKNPLTKVRRLGRILLRRRTQYKRNKLPSLQTLLFGVTMQKKNYNDFVSFLYTLNERMQRVESWLCFQQQGVQWKVVDDMNKWLERVKKVLMSACMSSRFKLDSSSSQLMRCFFDEIMIFNNGLLFLIWH
jgi:hypothetical protein